MSEQAYVHEYSEWEGEPDPELAAAADAEVIALHGAAEEDEISIDEAEQNTGRLLDTTRVYLEQAGQEPLLTAEQEVQLAKRIEAGLYAGKLLTDETLYDQSTVVQKMIQDGHSAAKIRRDLNRLADEGTAARQRFIRANLLLAVSIAKKPEFTKKAKTLTLQDLIQEGNDGLMHAVSKFDFTKGWKFSTYATTWIRQRIGVALGEIDRVVTLKRHQQEDVNGMHKRRRDLLDTLGREPTEDELAAEMEISLDELHTLQEWDILSTPASLEEQVAKDDERAKSELLVDENSMTEAKVEATLREQAIRQAFSYLSDREVYVVQEREGLKDGEPKDYEAIAKRLGLPLPLVREAEARGWAKLHHPSIAGRLYEYVRND